MARFKSLRKLRKSSSRLKIPDFSRTDLTCSSGRKSCPEAHFKEQIEQASSPGNVSREPWMTSARQAWCYSAITWYCLSRVRRTEELIVTGSFNAPATIRESKTTVQRQLGTDGYRFT